MNVNVLLGIFFAVVIVVFGGCMFFIPELLGISKDEEKQSDEANEHPEKKSP